MSTWKRQAIEGLADVFSGVKQSGDREVENATEAYAPSRACDELVVDLVDPHEPSELMARFF